MKIYEFDHKRKIFTIAREIHNKEEIHHRKKNVEKMALSNWSSKGKYCITCFNLASIADGDHMPITTKIFIYNTYTHKLEHIINNENSAVNLKTNFLSIEAHPIFEQYMLTGDHDGQVVIWNLITGSAEHLFLERGVHIGYPLIAMPTVDCKWSPCGRSFIVSTVYGSFTLYGSGDNSNLLHQPYEQFFSRDSESTTCNPETGEPIDTHNNNQRWDKESQGFFCDIKFNFHDNLEPEYYDKPLDRE